MALVINTNIASLNAQRNLNTSQSQLNTALQRLSSGLRINSAADDAAGLFFASRLTSTINGDNQAIRNAGDGISLAQTADGALGQISNNLQRIREIAIQASSSTVGDASGLQKEVNQLTQEISRIVQTTNFNGTNLLSGTNTLNFQVGASGSSTNQITVKTDNISGIDAYASSLTATGTIDVTTTGAASAALSGLSAAIDSVNNARATYGAIQNRFQAVIANLQNSAQNLTAARSRIQDTDFASATANLTRAKILQQAGTSILAQANALPQTALTLLR